MAPEAQSVVRSAQAWLQSSCQVQVPFAWLEACVQWLQEEAGGAGRLTQQQINKQVYDQWLLTDLRDLDHPILPEGLAQSQKTVLSGIFCVQKWKGTDCTNDEVSRSHAVTQKPWESRPTRMLLLQVTDGVHNMEAMEYQPISALSTSLRSSPSVRNGFLQNGRAERQLQSNQPQTPPIQSPPRQNYNTDQDFPDEDFDDLPLDELDSVILQDLETEPPQNLPPALPNQPQNLPVNAPTLPQNPSTAATNYDDDFMDEDLEFIDGMEVAGSSNQTDSNTNAVSLTSPPFTYICLLDNLPNKDKVEIVVKAFIVTLIGKLTTNNGFWKVGATISDGTGYLDVELSDEVLRGLLGFSVAEKAAMKRDPARKGELEAGMRKCQEGLVDMCCVMTLCVDLGQGKALVTKAEPVNEKDLRALEERVKAGE
ncbi:hypothetical protein WMY93_004707 [Mugilogobius chulae]|uniref:RecQ-mediated genome instability protein 1 n=1 Tax=Mugilogobius chulae TaxID=88201 RepID=A0AAW0PSV8_9GOBI